MDKNTVIGTNDYGELINPSLAKKLALLHLDKIYHKAKGSYLYYFDDRHEEVKVVDFVSGYGAVLLGHGDAQLNKSAVSFLEEGRPVFAQLSIKDSATRLAMWMHHEMKTVTGSSFITCFANSGAEAVEAAIKHALIEFYEKIDEFTRKFEQEADRLLHEVALNDAGRVPLVKKELNGYRLRNNRKIKLNTPLVLAARFAFHGKTLRASTTCWNPEYSRPFHRGSPATVFIDPDSDKPEEIFQEFEFKLMVPIREGHLQLQPRQVTFNRISAAIMEPIQGEGGIRIVSASFLKQLSQHCAVHNVPFIFDEIQTGCFRTGDLLASAETGVVADYYLLGKALGGGLAKISALLINKNRFRSQFGIIHSSTFAEDGWTSHVALQALELSKAKAPEIQRKGAAIIQRLNHLKRAYPSVIRDVRGCGLMIGLEFRDFSESNSYCLQLMARSGYLHYLYAAYLLNVWDLRLAAPLSANNVLRIQPAVSVSDRDTDQLFQGLSALCEILYCEDFYKLIEFSLPESCQGLRESPEHFIHGNIPREEPLPGARKIGFLTHFIDANTVRECDPSLNILDNRQIETLIEEIVPIASPVIEGSKNIKDDQGRAVHITFSGLCMTSALCRNAISKRTTKPLADLCEKAVELLRDEEGVELVGLGQYTSILTNNGLLIPGKRVGLTSGNSYTVYLGMETIRSCLAEKNKEPVKIGIIGAAGNIASIMAEMFSETAAGIILLGNSNQNGYENAVRTARNIYQKTLKELLGNGSVLSKGLKRWLVEKGIIKKLQSNVLSIEDSSIYEKLENEFGNGLFLKVERSIDALRDCPVIIAATNAAKPFLNADYFSPHTIICDLSVPHNCGPDLVHNNKFIEVIFGGIARLPNHESIPVKGFPLGPGEVYGCIGETLLLGLEGYEGSFSLGNINRRQVEWIGKIAANHGFCPVPVRNVLAVDA